MTKKLNEITWLIQELKPKIQAIYKIVNKKRLSRKKKLILVNNLLYNFNLGLRLLDRFSEKFHFFDVSCLEEKKELDKDVRGLYEDLKKHRFNCYPDEQLEDG